MFYGTGVHTLDLSSFDVRNVLNMTYMLGNCEILTSLNISSFDLNENVIVKGIVSGVGGIGM